MVSKTRPVSNTLDILTTAANEAKHFHKMFFTLLVYLRKLNYIYFMWRKIYMTNSCFWEYLCYDIECM